MSSIVCPGCKRSVEPLERVETDKKAKKSWIVYYCPFERCKFNIDIEICNVKVWNDRIKYFEDYTSGD